MDTSPSSSIGKLASTHDREDPPKEQHISFINSKCTEVSNDFKGKSCARIIPATVTYQGKAVPLYAMLEDQIIKTLAKKEGSVKKSTPLVGKHLVYRKTSIK